MQFKTTSHVSKMAPSKGDFINDDKETVSYDSTKITVLTDLKEDYDGFGVAHVDYKWGKSDNYYDFIKSHPIREPFEAEITWENVSNGKTSTLTIIDVKPLTNNQKTTPKP